MSYHVFRLLQYSLQKECLWSGLDDKLLKSDQNNILELSKNACFKFSAESNLNTLQKFNSLTSVSGFNSQNTLL